MTKYIKKIMDIPVNYEELRKYFLKPYIQQTLSETIFTLEDGDKKK